jgi:hypothetical protein
LKHCRYILEISGDVPAVNVLRLFVDKNQSSLSDSREISRAITTIFGDSVQSKITVVRVEMSSAKKYSLSPDGKHKQ